MGDYRYRTIKFTASLQFNLVNQSILSMYIVKRHKKHALISHSFPFNFLSQLGTVVQEIWKISVSKYNVDMNE